jgi:hypothetical protein
MSNNSVYFRKMRINENTKNVTIYVTSKPLTQSETNFLGFDVTVRDQDTIVSGQLNFVDPKTKKTMTSNHPMVKKLKATKPGTEIKGFTINTDAPVRNIETGDPLRNLYWVEAVASE